jgi:hypothetical protein
MIDTFYIGAYWQERKELLENVVEPTVKTLIELSKADEQFVKKYELGANKKQALEHEVSISKEDIEKLYSQGLKKNDIDKDGYSKIGYRLSLWTGHKNEKSCKISFTVGKNSVRLRPAQANAVYSRQMGGYPYRSEYGTKGGPVSIIDTNGNPMNQTVLSPHP